MIAMKIIEQLCDMITEELEDAHKYAKCALKRKEEYPHLADTFSRLSEEEMRHVSMLHAEVVSLIDSYRKEHGEPPEAMMAVYEYLHERHIDKASEVKAVQAMYKQ